MRKLLTINNLALLAIFCMPLYLVRMNIFGLPTNVFEILVTLTIVLLFLKERRKILEKFLSLPKLFLLSVCLILSGVLLSILFNDNYRAGFGILKSWFLIPILFSFLLYVISDSKEKIEKIFLAIYLSATFIGLISVFYKILNLVTYDGRLEAFYSSPNYLAMYLSSGIFFGFYFLVKSWLQKKYSVLFFINVFLILLIIISLYFTYSYSAWLAVFITLFFELIFLFSKKKVLVSVLFFIAMTTTFIFQANTSKFSTLINLSKRSSFASRIMIWESSLLMIEKNPILGIGPGNFQNTYLDFQKYFPPYLEWAVPEPHNIFLAFWLQAGILGLTGFLLLLFFIFKTIFNIIKNKKDALLVAPLLGFFVYTILHGLADTTYWKNDLAFLFWINLFLLMHFYAKRSSNFS